MGREKRRNGITRVGSGMYGWMYDDDGGAKGGGRKRKGGEGGEVDESYSGGDEWPTGIGKYMRGKDRLLVYIGCRYRVGRVVGFCSDVVFGVVFEWFGYV